MAREPAAGERDDARRDGLWGFALLAAVLPLFLGLALLALLTSLTPATLVRHLASDMALRALALTLRTTLVATLITVALGTPLAYVLARRRFPGRAEVDVIVDLPITIPPVVAGVLLCRIFLVVMEIPLGSALLAGWMWSQRSTRAAGQGIAA